MRHLPNLVSALRIAMTPYVCLLIGRHEFAAVVSWFAVAAFTDAADGALARWLKVESKLGEVLDPIADKILLTAVFLALSSAGAVPWWLTAVVIGRDVLILGVAAGLLSMGSKRRFPPSWWGKVSTIVQMAYVLAVVATGGDVVWLGFVVAGLAFISGLDYGRRVCAS